MYRNRERATQFLRDTGIEIADDGLKNLDHRGRGPERVVINGRVLYTEEALLRWIAAQAAQPGRRGRRIKLDASAA